MAIISTINVSTPDSGLGDTLRDSQVKANDNFAELNTKKVEVAPGFGLSENNYTDADKTKLDSIEVGAEINVPANWLQDDPDADDYIFNKPDTFVNSIGWFMYADLATNTTPIPFVAGVPKKLTNDTLGTSTNIAYPPLGVSTLWDSVNNQMIASECSLGDIINMRFIGEVTTTSANQVFSIQFKSGIGSVAEVTTTFFSDSTKTAGTLLFAINVQVVVGTLIAQSYPNEFYILSDGNGTIKVKNFLFSVLRRNMNIVSIPADVTKEDTANKKPTIVGNEASTTFFATTKAIADYLKEGFISLLPAKSTDLVDADLMVIGDSADVSKTKTRTFAQLKSILKTYFDSFYLAPQITITTSVSITTATVDGVTGLGQNGRHVVIANGASAINITCNGGVTTSYGKGGTAAITFVQGSGRTLVQLSGTAILSGIAGSKASLWSNGTIDYLEITNY